MPIEYFEIPEMPGKRMFQCAPLRATIQVETCKDMWVKANGKDAPERLHRCKQCVVGAGHVGVVLVCAPVLVTIRKPPSG